MVLRRSVFTLALALALLPAGSAHAGDDIPDKRMYDVYGAVQKAFGVDGRIIAAIHFTEHTYGKGAKKGLYKGPYGFGDSAWGSHKRSYKKGKRPKDYPFASKDLKRCDGREPCIHDLFDAAMAAGSFLRAAGADGELESRGTRKALCFYNTGTDSRKCDYEKRVIKKASEYKQKNF